MNMNRQNYRKNLKIDGTMVIGVNEIRFFTTNVSLNGFQACFSEPASLEKGDIVYVRLPMLSMKGMASTIWKNDGHENIYHIGFKFLNMRGVGGRAYHYRESDRHG